jgi:hypothetical protein
MQTYGEHRKRCHVDVELFKHGLDDGVIGIQQHLTRQETKMAEYQLLIKSNRTKIANLNDSAVADALHSKHDDSQVQHNVCDRTNEMEQSVKWSGVDSDVRSGIEDRGIEVGIRNTSSKFNAMRSMQRSVSEGVGGPARFGCDDDDDCSDKDPIGGNSALDSDI